MLLHSQYCLFFILQLFFSGHHLVVVVAFNLFPPSMFTTVHRRVFPPQISLNRNKYYGLANSLHQYTIPRVAQIRRGVRRTLFRGLQSEMINRNTANIHDVHLKYFCNFKGKLILIVGDGDFSFAHELAARAQAKQIVATTFEDPDSLLARFPKAQANIPAILNLAEEQRRLSKSEFPKYDIMYKVDATNISLSRSNDSMKIPNQFDLIVWNFPHIPGKQNIRYNRELLFSFLFHISTTCILKDDGNILLSLCEGQSGIESTTKYAYDSSWQLMRCILNSRMILKESEVFYFDQFFKEYRPLGRRNRDDAIRPGLSHYYRIGKPNIEPTSTNIQNYQNRPHFIHSNHSLLCAHEIALLMPQVLPNPIEYINNLKSIVQQLIVEFVTQHFQADPSLSVNQTSSSILPSEYLNEDEMKAVLHSISLVDLYLCPQSSNFSHTLQIVYSSKKYPFTRGEFNAMKDYVELHIAQRLRLR
jgi:hypothetical protein